MKCIIHMFPSHYTAIIRLEAAEIRKIRPAHRAKRIRQLETQIISKAARAGLKRWEAIKRADDFLSSLSERLAELESLSRGHSRVLSFERKATAGGAS